MNDIFHSIGLIDDELIDTAVNRIGKIKKRKEN